MGAFVIHVIAIVMLALSVICAATLGVLVEQNDERAARRAAIATGFLFSVGIILQVAS